ncbi:hypothetical protein PSTT_00706, partial [Puccinia striiformis]
LSSQLPVQVLQRNLSGQKNSSGNLETHRNGSRQEDKSDKGCPGRNKAKLAGCILPPSVAKSRAAATRGGVDAS